MKEVQVIAKGGRFFVSNGHLAYLTKKQELVVDGKELPGSFQDFRLWKEWVIAQTEERLAFYSLPGLQPGHSLEGAYYLQGFFEDGKDIFVAKDEQGYRRITQKGETYEVPWNIVHVKAIFPGIVLQAGPGSLSGYDLHNGTPLWQLEYKKLLNADAGRLMGRIAYYQNRIYIVLMEKANGDRAVAYGIDTTTGKVLHQWEGISGEFAVTGDNLYAVASSSKLNKLDLTSHRWETFDLKAILQPAKLDLNWWHWQVTSDGLFYFVDGLRQKNRFGVIDLRTKELLDVVEIDIDDQISNCIVKLDVHDARVYVHTSDEKIHIYT